MNIDYFQWWARDWVARTFGPAAATDQRERAQCFMEEALELAQAAGLPRREAQQLLDYVYGREKGVAFEEVGDVMQTLAALASANNITLSDAGSAARDRCEARAPHIREKWLKKVYRQNIEGTEALP